MNCNCAWMLVAVAASLVLLGCADDAHTTANASKVFKPASKVYSATTQYVIDAPDEIQITAPKIKELDGQKQTVRSDGMISFNMIGEVQVGGLTPAQTQKKLVELVTKYQTNPDIKVEVLAKSKFYMIFGRGSSTGGKKTYTGSDTVIKALAEAGMNDEAWPQRVRLVRPSREGRERAVVIIDFKEMAATGDFTQNYLLEADDLVYLPDSPLSRFNLDVGRVTGLLGGGAGATSSVRAAGH